MRWESLFADLEARLDLDERREHEAEVADRTRRERAQIPLHSRLLANVGRERVVVRLLGGSSVTGEICDVGPDWMLITQPDRRSALLSLTAVRDVVGLGRGAQEHSLVGKRFTMGAALRAVSRDRSAIELVDIGGQWLAGTIDSVGADHVDLAEHAIDEPRRERNVTRYHVVPFTALAAVRRR